MPVRIVTFLAAAVLCVFTIPLIVRAAVEPVLRIAVNATTIESFPVFAAAGERIQINPAPNGRNAMALLVSGEVDAATGSETQALLSSATDPRIRIILTLAECRYRIIARRSSGIRRISDLRGKKIAATMNTSSQYYVAGMLHLANLRESDAVLVPMEGPDMPAALKSGAVDAVSIWEPHAQRSLEALGSDAVVFENPSVYTERFNLNTRTDVLADRERRRALMDFVQAISAAAARIRTRPADVVPGLAPRINLSEKTVFAVWPQFRFPASLSDGLRTSLSEVELWVAGMQKRQPRSRQELAELIDSSLAKSR